jgi:beta-phosphoglucomutase
MTTGFRGAIFDVDGVLVDSPHEQAWREGLRQLMENEWSDIQGQSSYAPEKFTPEVYQKEMSGKPRFAGAQAVLEYFGVPDAERRAQEFGDRKRLTGRPGPRTPGAGERPVKALSRREV